MGAVYLCEAVRDDGGRHLVAIKVMKPGVESPDHTTMFIDEARIGLLIDDPHVVKVLDVSLHDERPVIVMEYIEGLAWSRIRSLTEDVGRLIPIDVATRVIYDTLCGLVAAHALPLESGQNAGVVHRDVSPHNILVGTDGHARITDFGIATFRGRSVATSSGCVRGKFQYMSPEQILCESVDQRADVFAAGVVLWEALAGRSLFEATTYAEVLSRILRHPIPPPSSFRDGLPPALEDVCLRALERDPERRYSSATEFAQALRDAAAPLASDGRVRAFLEELGVCDSERTQLALERARHERSSALPVLPVTVQRTPAGSHEGRERQTFRSQAVMPSGVWCYAICASLFLFAMGAMIGPLRGRPPASAFPGDHGTRSFVQVSAPGRAGEVMSFSPVPGVLRSCASGAPVFAPIAPVPLAPRPRSALALRSGG